MLQQQTDMSGTIGVDRRVEERNELRFMLVAILLHNRELRRVPVETTDLSARGIGFFSKHGFEPGSYFAVRLYTDGRPEKLMLCRASFCEPKNAGNYRTGAEIIEALPSESRVDIPPAWFELAAGSN